MAVLEQSEEDGIGGALELYLFKESDVSADTGENFLFSNYTKIIYIPESIRFTEKQKKTASGTIFQPKIIYTLAKDRADLQKFCKDNIGNFFIALLKTSNGDTLKIGTKENPLELNFDRDSGRKYTDRSERNFELSGESDSESIFYTNPPSFEFISIVGIFLAANSFTIDYYAIINWNLGEGADTDMVSVKLLNEQKGLQYELPQVATRNDNSYYVLDLLQKLPNTAPGDVVKFGISVRNEVGTDSPYIYAEQAIGVIPYINLGLEIFANFLCLQWADNSDGFSALSNDKLIVRMTNLATLDVFVFQPANRNAKYINIPGAFGTAGSYMLVEYRMQNASNTVSSVVGGVYATCQPAVVFSLSPNEFSFSPSVNSRMVEITSNRPWQVVDGAANVSPNNGNGNANLLVTQNALSGQGERNYLFKNNLNMFLNVKVTVGAYLSPTSEILLDVDANGSFTIEGNVGNWTAFLSMQDIFQSFTPSSGGNGNTAINYFVSLYDLEGFWVDGQNNLTLRYRAGDSNIDLVYPIGFYLANVVISLGDTVESPTSLMIFNWADNSLNILARNDDKLVVEIIHPRTNSIFYIAESAGVRRDAGSSLFQIPFGVISAGDDLEVKYYTKRANGWKSRTTTLNVPIQESISLAGIFLVADSFTFDYYAILNWDLVAGPGSDLVSVKLLNELKALEHTLPQVAGRNDNSYYVLSLLQKLPNTTPGDIIKIGISVRNSGGTDSAYIYTEQAIAVIPNISLNAEVFANLLHIDWVDNSNGSTAFSDDILFFRLKNLATLEVFEFPAANRNSINANFDGRTLGASGNNMLLEYRMQNASNTVSSTVGSLNIVCQSAVVFSITPKNFAFPQNLNSMVVAIISNRPWEVLSNAGDVSPNTGTGNTNTTITKNLALSAGTASYLFKNNLGMFINVMAEIEAFLMPTADFMLDAETNGSITIAGNRGNWTALVSPQNIFQSFSPSSGGNGNTAISYFASLTDLETFYIDGSSNLTLSYTNTANVLVDLVFPIKFRITNITLVVADSVASPGRLVLNWTDNSANLLSRNDDKIVAEIKNLTTNAVFSITEADGVTRGSLTKKLTGSFGTVGQVLEVKYNTIRPNGWKSTTSILNITIQATTYLIASTGNYLVDGAGNRLTTF